MHSPSGPLTPEAALMLGVIYCCCAAYLAGCGLSRILNPENAWQKHIKFLQASGEAKIERTQEWETENRRQGWSMLKLAAVVMLVAIFAWRMDAG